MRPRVHIALPLAVAALALLPAPARTEDAPGARDCATVLLTCLGYVTADAPAARERLRERGLGILALHDGELSSRTLANDVVAVARDWGRSNRVGGTHPIQGADTALYTGPEDLTRLLQEGRHGVVFVSEGLRSNVGDIALVAREAKVVTACVSRSNVEAGLAMGFAVADGRLVIYVNRTAAAGSGFRFHSALLRRARLVGE